MINNTLTDNLGRGIDTNLNDWIYIGFYNGERGRLTTNSGVRHNIIIIISYTVQPSSGHTTEQNV